MPKMKTHKGAAKRIKKSGASLTIIYRTPSELERAQLQRRLAEVPGSEREFPADLVTLAMGFLGPEETLADKLGIRNGDIVHAEYDGQKGDKAFYRLLAAGRGAFKEVFYRPPPERSIVGSATHLLMEAARLMDEGGLEEAGGIPNELDDETSFAGLADEDEGEAGKTMDIGAEALLPEHERQEVAARPGGLVDHHHLGAADRPERSVEAFNAGCGGYTFFNYLGVLQKHLARMKRILRRLHDRSTPGHRL